VEEIELAIKQGRRYGDVEAKLTIEDEIDVSFENNKFKDVNLGTTVNLGIRVTNGLKHGYAQTSNLKNWRRCLINAVKLMKASNPLAIKPVLNNNKAMPKSSLNKKIDGLGINELISLSEQAIGSANNFKGVGVSNSIISKRTTNNYFSNSEGINANYKSNVVEFEIECTKDFAKGYDTRCSRELNINFSDVGLKTAELCFKSLNPIKIETRRVPVVLDYLAAENMIDTLAYNLLADSVIENRSFFKGKEGQKVTSEMLTLTDEGQLTNGLFSRPFDEEGTKTGRTLLIDNGVLRGFVYDLYTAKRAGRKSTGNCSSLIKRPSVGFNNLIVKAGSASKEDIIDNSLFINQLLGTHMINYISGDFSVSPNNAFLIKKGVWTPLKNIMISGNLFELFNNIESIGRDQRQDNQIMTPLIRFKDVQVIG